MPQLSRICSNRTLKNLFEARVIVDKITGCWIWQTQVSTAGYGRLRFLDETLMAHRVAYELYNGPIPPDTLVCHACDNPPCANPSHLFLGDNADNMQDMVNKGRSGIGVKNNKCKTNEEDVIKIRQEYAKGDIFQVDLGLKYGLSQLTISNIVTRRTWKHI